MLATAFMEKGDLCTALGKFPDAFIWSKLGKRVAMDVARGLAFLHSRNVVVSVSADLSTFVFRQDIIELPIYSAWMNCIVDGCFGAYTSSVKRAVVLAGHS